MILASVVLSLVAGVASAEGGGKGASGWEFCKADAERVGCAQAKNPGMCLHEHWDELSTECRAFKQKMKKDWESKNSGKKKPQDEAGMAACKADAEKVGCLDKPNPGMCLHEHWDELSPACQKFRSAKKT